MSHQLDTNVLLRSVQPAALEYPLVLSALTTLQKKGATLCITPQNLIEFWAVATRPVEVNGLGLAPEQVEQEIDYLRRRFTLLPDSPAIFAEWLRLVKAAGTRGRQVHDARLATVMRVHGITHLLTFNGSDFTRYPGITMVHPRDVPAPPPATGPEPEPPRS